VSLNLTLSIVAAKYGKYDLVFAGPDGTVVLTEAADLATGDGRQAAAKRLAPRLAELKGEAVNAEHLEAHIEAAWNAFYGERLKAEAKKAEPPPGAPTADELLKEMPHDVVKEAHLLLAGPEPLKAVLADVAAAGVVGELELAATIALACISRHLPNPVSLRVHGPSGSGKSFVLERQAWLLPPEAVLHATSLTSNALYYMEPGGLYRRVIVGGERQRGRDDDVAENTRALREMISSGRLTKVVTVKEDGRIVTRTITQDGPIVFAETTTIGQVFAEDANRVLPLVTDETQEQTELILRADAERAMHPTDPAVLERVRLRQFAVQRMLKGEPIAVPYAGQLMEKFPKMRVEARRAFPMVLRMLEASALLHRATRSRDGNGAILAAADDYQLVRRLLAAPMGRLIGTGITPAAMRFLNRLRTWGVSSFTVEQARKREEASKSSVKNWLGELREASLIEVIESGRGPKGNIYGLTGTTTDEDRILPKSEDLYFG
jgi:hypothetical protein